MPVPPGSRFTAVVLGASREFCCPGCQAVKRLPGGTGRAQW
ncbi:heavy metal translocating P-type ATPase metal-binding domain-containing protein [Pseudomonas sp. COW3]|nr:heavy metal translocating P-type ATPase metal-binding domain-containing protein [Pseudomonas botevensis]